MRQPPRNPMSVLENNKNGVPKHRLSTKILWPYRRLKSLADEGTVVGSGTVATTTTREPPSDMQVVAESCDWCGVEAPWDDEVEGTDDASILEDEKPTQTSNPRPPLQPVADSPTTSSSWSTKPSAPKVKWLRKSCIRTSAVC